MKDNILHGYGVPPSIVGSPRASDESGSQEACETRFTTGAQVIIDTIFRLHGLPSELVFDRNPRFTAEFWQSVVCTLGTRLKMSTSDHPNRIVRQNVQTVSSKRYFEGTSAPFRVGVNSCRCSNSPSTTPCMRRQRIHRSTCMAYATHVFHHLYRVTLV